MSTGQTGQSTATTPLVGTTTPPPRRTVVANHTKDSKDCLLRSTSMEGLFRGEVPSLMSALFLPGPCDYSVTSRPSLPP